MIIDAAENTKQFEQAMDFAQQQVYRLTENYPDFFPMYTLQGKWKHGGEAWTNWCEGFLGGMMWIFHARSLEEDSGSGDYSWFD